MGHQNILTLVDYFETMNNRALSAPGTRRRETDFVFEQSI